MSSFIVRINKCTCDNCRTQGERVLNYDDSSDELPPNWFLLEMNLQYFTATGKIGKKHEKTFCCIECLKEYLATTIR